MPNRARDGKPFIQWKLVGRPPGRGGTRHVPKARQLSRFQDNPPALDVPVEGLAGQSAQARGFGNVPRRGAHQACEVGPLEFFSFLYVGAVTADILGVRVFGMVELIQVGGANRTARFERHDALDGML